MAARAFWRGAAGGAEAALTQGRRLRSFCARGTRALLAILRMRRNEATVKANECPPGAAASGEPTAGVAGGKGSDVGVPARLQSPALSFCPVLCISACASLA